MRRLAVFSALLGTLIFSSSALAAPVTVPADPGFSTTGTWSTSTTCGLLCTTTASQPTTGGNPGGELVAGYTTVANVIGLAAGQVDALSSSFTWTGASPASATLHFDRSSNATTLLALGGSSSTKIALIDATDGQTTTLTSQDLTANEATWHGTDVSIPASLLQDSHSYQLRIRTAFSALANVLGGATVSYDNVGISATLDGPQVLGTTVGTPCATSVNIAANANALGLPGLVSVQYGPTTSYGSTTSSNAFTGLLGITALSTPLTSLTPSTLYHARVAVTTAGGTTYGPDVTFTTLASGCSAAQPIVGAPSITDILTRAAHAAASVNLNGIGSGTFRFEFGTTIGYGLTTSPISVPASPDSSGWSLVENDLAGLLPGTLYHIRAAVLANGIWYYGPDVTFTTLAPQPPVIGIPHAFPDIFDVEINVFITTHSSPTTYYVEYGDDTTYGHRTVTFNLNGNDNPQDIVIFLRDLLANHRYHYRIVVDNQDGRTTGPDQTVQTDESGPTKAESIDIPDPVVKTVTNTITNTVQVPVPATIAKVPQSCATVRVNARSAGTTVHAARYITNKAPLSITVPRAVKGGTVTVDGKVVPVVRVGRSIRIAASALATGKSHVIRVRKGSKSVRVTLRSTRCAPLLKAARVSGGVALWLQTAPGSTTAAFVLPAKLAAAATKGKLVVGKRTVKVGARTAATGTTGITATATKSGVTVRGLPSTGAILRLTLRTKAASALKRVSATVATGAKTQRVSAHVTAARR